MPAGVQSVEIGDAIDTQDDGLAIEHKLLDAVLRGGFDDPWIALRPVVTAARKQADAVTVPANPEAVAVVFYFMEPIGAAGDDRRPRRKAELERARHGG